LRGRSFYLQLLTETVVLYTLAQLNLPITNLLYAGGGNFYLLAPSEKVKRSEEIQTQVTQRLFQAHEGGLRLVLAWTPVSAREFRAGAFADVWDQLHRRLHRVKERPLAELETNEMLKYLGQVSNDGGNQTICPVCGREKSDDRDQPCSLCQSLEDLGRQLAYATHLVIAQRPAPKNRCQHISKWWQGLEQFGINVWPVDTRRLPGDSGYLPGGSGEYNLLRVYPLIQGAEPRRAEPDLFRQASARGPTVVASRLFAQLVPYIYPKDEKQERIATFDELAKHSQGIKRWGVLRMDVDNLGKLFRDGFKGEENGQEVNNLTLSRLASFSFALSLFFEGYVTTIGQHYQKYTATLNPKHQAGEQSCYDKLYVQYAGGDDLFVVGAWDALPEFAANVRGKFAEYVCHNPSITLSGGITLHPAKFPLYQAADQAGLAEHAAKSFRRQVNGQEVKKDAVVFLGRVLGWDDLAKAQKRQQTILDWLDQGAPHAIIQQLRTLYQEWLDGQEKAKKEGRLKANQFYYGPWIWHAVYQLNRTANSHKKIKAEIHEWEKQLLEQGNSFISLLGLAARWADYLTRTSKGD
jgi:CRISPR-associated protein Csm1